MIDSQLSWRNTGFQETEVYEYGGNKLLGSIRYSPYVSPTCPFVAYYGNSKNTYHARFEEAKVWIERKHAEELKKAQEVKDKTNDYGLDLVWDHVSDSNSDSDSVLFYKGVRIAVIEEPKPQNCHPPIFTAAYKGKTNFVSDSFEQAEKWVMEQHTQEQLQEKEKMNIALSDIPTAKELKQKILNENARKQVVLILVKTAVDALASGTAHTTVSHENSEIADEANNILRTKGYEVQYHQGTTENVLEVRIP